MSYQVVIIQGNLTRDAEIRQVGQNTVASIGVATSRRFKKQDGTIVEETEFHNVEYWNAGAVQQYLVKGQSVLVQGEIRTEKWQDQQGNNRETKKIRASILQLCGSPRQQGQQPQQYAQAPMPPQAPAAPQYAQAPVPPPAQPQYQAPQPPAAPQYQQPQPPMPPQPGQPGNQQYPPMNSPQYTQGGTDDLPF